MKSITCLICLTIFTSGNYVLFAQTANTPKGATLTIDTTSKPTLYVLKIDTELKIISDSLDNNFNAFSIIDLEWVKSIVICKDEQIIRKYGARAKNGVVVIELYKKYFKNLPYSYREKFQLASAF